MSTVRLAAVGDIMCGESFYRYGRGPRTHLRYAGIDYLAPSVRSILGSHQVVLGNVECPLSDVGYHRWSLRRHHMRGTPEVAALLADWGFNAVTLANNHILEHGLAAARDTADSLTAAGIAVAGAGPNHDFESGPGLARLTRGGLRIAVIGACLLLEKYAFNGGLTPDALVRAVSELTCDSDIIIVMVHWGMEFCSLPDEEQRHLARRLVAAGATAIIGSHPHVVQGVEIIDDALVAYSLGNFIFDQPLPETRIGAILSCDIIQRRVVDCTLVPVVLNEMHSPVLADGDEQRRLQVEFAELRDTLGEHSEVDYRQARDVATTRERRFREQLRCCLRHTMIQSGPLFALQALARPIARRLNMW
ncbi:MAG: hypothetical protein AMXMBFR47_14270 [Planctomycetota bacterium]